MNYCKSLLLLFNALLDFDRVMVYQFEPDWSGKVQVEVTQEGQEKVYENLYFPATDIPPQARALYKTQRVRYIPNVQSGSIRLLSESNNTPINIGHCQLQSLGKTHLEYLKNLQVDASLSICDDQDNLWGIIICHHQTPYKVHPLKRLLCGLIGNKVGIHLSHKNIDEDLKEDGKLTAFLDNLSESLDIDIDEQINKMLSDVLPIFEVEGALIKTQNKEIRAGMVPDSELCDQIKNYAKTRLEDGLFLTHQLSIDFPNLPFMPDASGILFLSLSRFHDEYLMLFRPERIKTIEWAGDPNKPAKVINDEIHPRKSFERWQQEVDKQSASWSQLHQRVGYKLRRVLYDRISWSKQKKAEAFLKQSEVHAQTARQEAQKTSHAKSTFLRMVSHEIQTPINGISGMVDLALDTDLSPVQHKYLKSIESLSDILSRVLNDILEFSKLQAGELKLEKRSFILEDILQEIETIYRTQAEEKGLGFFSHCEQSVLFSTCLIGDSSRIQQVLMNLLDNALKFTEEGSISVSTHIIKKDAAEIEVVFSISDTGEGMTPERIATAFQPFMVGNGSTTRTKGGSGLGMSISQKLIEMMNGKIWVESALGEGTTCKVMLNLSMDDEQKNQIQHIHHVLDHQPVLVSSTILENDSRLSDFLNQLGLSFAIPQDDLDALNLINQKNDEGNPFKILILDHKAFLDSESAVFNRFQNSDLLQKQLLIVAKEQADISFLANQLPYFQGLYLDDTESHWSEAIINQLASGALPDKQKSKPSAEKRFERLFPLNILIADDNATNRELFKGLLAGRGGNYVKTVSNGREAVEAVKESLYDVVLMDIEMPEMDGIEATKEIRMLSGPSSKTLIMALTAQSTQESYDQCMAAGMNAFLSKPVRRQELYEALSKYLVKDTDPVNKSKINHPQPKDQSLENSSQISKNSGSSHSNPVNMEALIDEFQGDLLIVKQLANTFLSDLTSQTQSLEEGFSIGDYRKIGLVAHGIKGMAAHFGAEDIRASAHELEKMGKEETQDLLLIENMQACFEKFKNQSEELQTYINAYSWDDSEKEQRSF